MGTRASESGPLRRGREHHRRENVSLAQDRQLERNALSPWQRQCSGRIPQLPGTAPVSPFQFRFSRYAARAVPDAFAISARPAVDLFGGGMYRRAAWDRVFAPGSSGQRCQCGRTCFFNEFSNPSFSRTRRGRPHLAAGGRLDAKSRFRGDRALFALPARDQPRRAALSTCRRAAYIRPMNPLPNDWAIKHRADACAATQSPFEAGEYFYTLLFRDAGGFRREDLSEEAWKNRNENIQPFSFWKTRYEPLPDSAPEPLAKENAEQLFRRLISSEKPPANTCYVLAAMLERKRVFKQIKTENAEKGRLLIYEHGATGDAFIVPDPGLRLDELENVQNEVAQLLRSAAYLH